MTRLPDRLEKFRRISLFSGCSDKELKEIDRLSDEVEIEAGRTIITQGGLGQEFASITSGEAEIVRDGIVVATLGPGDYFGEVALIDAIPRSATVVAKTDMQLEVIDRRGFNTLLDDMPQLSRSILKGLAHRLTEVSDEISRLKAERDPSS